MKENIEDNEDRDVIDLPLEELRYKHIVLRNLQKTAIREIDALEDKNLKLTDEAILLRAQVQRLSATNATSTTLMVNALTNNNNMKDDYRKRIQDLEKKLDDCNKKE
jgi:hypothetical protein